MKQNHVVLALYCVRAPCQVLSPVDKLAGLSTSDLYGQDFSPERFGTMPKQFSLDALRQRSLLGPEPRHDPASKNISLGERFASQ